MAIPCCTKRTAELFRDLEVAHADGSIARVLLKISRIDVLLLDDFAMAPMKDAERRDFLEICDDRYQSRPMNSDFTGTEGARVAKRRVVNQTGLLDEKFDFTLEFAFSPSLASSGAGSSGASQSGIIAPSASDPDGAPSVFSPN